MRTAYGTIRSLKISIALLVSAVLLLCSAGQAPAESRVQVTTIAEVERNMVSAKGQPQIQRMQATQVMPGDTLVFTTYYENTGDATAENAVIINPIPKRVAYISGSAQGLNAKITYSIDGGKTYRKATELIVKDQAGREYPARPQDYTHIRWALEIPLPPGTMGAVSFKATLR